VSRHNVATTWPLSAAGAQLALRRSTRHNLFEAQQRRSLERELICRAAVDSFDNAPTNSSNLALLKEQVVFHSAVGLAVENAVVAAGGGIDVVVVVVVVAAAVPIVGVVGAVDKTGADAMLPCAEEASAFSDAPWADFSEV
jgi:hypothetical protein